MNKLLRSIDCGGLRRDDVGKKVTLSGWVHRRRDHGGVIFIDLRDRFGLTQIIFRPDRHPAIHEKANRLRSEWVVGVTGTVVLRAEGMTNPHLKTGEIELEVEELTIYSSAKTPPFSISENCEANEELRLKYRYLDMRRGELIERLLLRHKMILLMRNCLSNQNFIEVATPILAKSTPEGARDYLVPSRVYPGSFYALPQSPQIFKQLLMIGGLDRYFQIATCFRDEDLRADRQPEFTQLDIEMSFGTMEALFSIIEKLIITLMQELKQVEIKPGFRSMTHAFAISNYGTDKPDLRFEMPLIDLSEIAKASQFTVFTDTIASGGIVKGLNVKGGATLSRKQIDEYTTFVSSFRAKGLAWIKMGEEGPTSNIVKYFSADNLQALTKKMEAQEGDLLLFVADRADVTHQALDHLRRKLGHDLNLIDNTKFEFAWVTDFPLFEIDKESGGLASAHHPFTAPHPDDIPLLEKEPTKVRSHAYDLVLNGYELGSGSERIFNNELQTKIFSLLKMGDDEIKKRFGFFIEALQYGTPPHMGIALGVDRLAMILSNASGIRDVIAFPKTQKAFDLMSSAPSEVLKEQLTELKIHIEAP